MTRPTVRTATAILLGIGLFFLTYFVADLLLLGGITGAADVDGFTNVIIMGLALLVLALDLSEPQDARCFWRGYAERHSRRRIPIIHTPSPAAELK